MTEVVPAPVDPPAVKPKKSAPKSARKSGSPSVKDLIIKIVSESKDRKGISVASIKKNLAAKGYDVEKNKYRIRLALKNLVVSGTLNQTSGVGASGSFKLAKITAEPKKRSRSAVASKATPVKRSASKPKGSKKPRTPQKAKKQVKPKASPKKKPSKAAPKPAAAKKTTPVKKRKAPTPKKPMAKKAEPKKAAKKAGRPRAKKTAAKK